MKPITDDQLNLMFNNFAKISQWLSKGKEAKYPLPFIFETLFNEKKKKKNEMTELKNQIKPLDNTSPQEPETEPETQTEEVIADNPQAEPETEPQTNFTMEEVETGEINEEAFIELDKQLNNLLAE